MTYLDYVIQFWRAVKGKSVPSSAVSVYFYLLDLGNSFYWAMPFSCSTSLICEKICISRQTFNVARRFLTDLKLISFTEGSSRFSHPTYIIRKLTDCLTEKQTAEMMEDMTEGLTDDMTPIISKEKDLEEDIALSEAPSLCAEPLSASPTPFNSDIDFCAFQIFFNQCMLGRQIPAIKSMSDKRKGMVRARIKEYGKDDVVRAIRKAANSNFLNGGTGSFIATFDWLFKPNNFLKILEGNYDDKMNNIKIYNNGNTINRTGGKVSKDGRTEQQRFADAKNAIDEKLGSPVII